jgi:tetratricopeptide (TPR) repeat protein
MAPVAIHDRSGYLGLLSTLVNANAPAGTRLILRDEADTPVVAPHLIGAPLTRSLPLDLGPEAMERSLEQEMEDEGLPLEQRMQSVLSLAFLDYAHKRYPQALEKYNFLLGHYQGVDNKAMQALVLCGMGDIYHREAQLDQARQWYETAVPPAAQGDSPMIFFSVVNNLGDVAYEQGRYVDAEQLYDSAEQLATHLGDPEGKARMLERRGLSQEQQRRAADAVRSFEDAAQLCRGVGLDPQLRDNLGHLERIYADRGMGQRLEAVQAERRSLEQRLEEQQS